MPDSAGAVSGMNKFPYQNIFLTKNKRAFIDAQKEDYHMAKKALEGILVLDFSQLLAGPYATQMLGDLGADVIKIERVGTGDQYRGMTFFAKYIKDKQSPLFMAWNRNKRSLAVNLRNEEVKKIIYDMVKQADVIVENFRPGVMERLGFGYEKLKEINPRIVYASNSGYGSTGPYVKRPGQDMLVQGMVGLASMTGRKDWAPHPLGTTLPDVLSGLHMVYGILAALISCQRTGEGQHVEVDLMRSAMALESQALMTLLNMDVCWERPSSGIGHPFQSAPFGMYECKDGYISVAIMGNTFNVLAEVLGEPKLMEYDDPDIRFEKRDEVFFAIEAITKTNTVDYWVEKMLERDIWVAKVEDIDKIDQNPQVQHMHAITEYEHGQVGKVRCVAPAVTLSNTPAVIEMAPPLVGEHTREILKEFHVDEALVEKLFAEGALSEEHGD